MSILEAGAEAPDFILETDGGPAFRLSEHRDRLVVLYFYPEDDTPACTIENNEFTALAQAFDDAGAILVGISPDSVSKHAKFRSKHGLTTILASDPDREVIGKYGVWGEKLNYGRRYMGLIRSTFLIGHDGRIAQSWVVRRTKGHAEKVLAATRDYASQA
ncbi:MAG TPA: peroxiredoxin [Devosiaceae bacterium]